MLSIYKRGKDYLYEQEDFLTLILDEFKEQLPFWTVVGPNEEIEKGGIMLEFPFNVTELPTEDFNSINEMTNFALYPKEHKLVFKTPFITAINDYKTELQEFKTEEEVKETVNEVIKHLETQNNAQTLIGSPLKWSTCPLTENNCLTMPKLKLKGRILFYKSVFAQKCPVILLGILHKNKNGGLNFKEVQKILKMCVKNTVEQLQSTLITPQNLRKNTIFFKIPNLLLLDVEKNYREEGSFELIAELCFTMKVENFLV